MPCLDKMKIEDIIFWLIIALIVGVAVWKMIGSPTDTSALIAVSLFVAGSEILIWKAMFNIDKKTSVGFIKIKNELENIKISSDNLNRKIDNIKNLIMGGRK